MLVYLDNALNEEENKQLSGGEQKEMFLNAPGKIARKWSHF